MTQAHLDRLSSIDAGFLHIEEDGAHMHIGALGVFEGPAPVGSAFRAHIDARLPQLPRYRQRCSRCRSAPAGRSGWRTPASGSTTTCGTPRCPRPVATRS